MAVAALIKAAKKVKDNELAKEMARIAYFMIDLVLPYKNLEIRSRLQEIQGYALNISILTQEKILDLC